MGPFSIPFWGKFRDDVAACKTCFEEFLGIRWVAVKFGSSCEAHTRKQPDEARSHREFSKRQSVFKPTYGSSQKFGAPRLGVSNMRITACGGEVYVGASFSSGNSHV